jgi:hypothetical protein
MEQTVVAIAVAVFTAIGALGTLAQGGVAYHDWACRNKGAFDHCLSYASQLADRALTV